MKKACQLAGLFCLLLELLEFYFLSSICHPELVEGPATAYQAGYTQALRQAQGDKSGYHLHAFG